MWAARPIWWRLLAQRMRLAAERTFWTAGRSRPMRMAMMAMTTSNSMSVKAERLRCMIEPLLRMNDKQEQSKKRITDVTECDDGASFLQSEGAIHWYFVVEETHD